MLLWAWSLFLFLNPLATFHYGDVRWIRGDIGQDGREWISNWGGVYLLGSLAVSTVIFMVILMISACMGIGRIVETPSRRREQAHNTQSASVGPSSQLLPMQEEKKIFDLKRELPKLLNKRSRSRRRRRRRKPPPPPPEDFKAPQPVTVIKELKASAPKMSSQPAMVPQSSRPMRLRIPNGLLDDESQCTSYLSEDSRSDILVPFNSSAMQTPSASVIGKENRNVFAFQNAEQVNSGLQKPPLSTRSYCGAIGKGTWHGGSALSISASDTPRSYSGSMVIGKSRSRRHKAEDANALFRRLNRMRNLAMLGGGSLPV
eukprot:jgi/Bigna1/139475/aug1.50_g14183